MNVRFADGSQQAYEDTVYKSGGEGDTYRSKDGRHLIKFYYDQSDPAKLRNRVDKLIHQYNPTLDDPYWEEFFAWPQKCAVAAAGKPRIGVRMRLVTGMRALEYYIFGKSFHRLPPEERGWFIGRIAVAIKLASAAQRLAALGLCYPDFSDRNVLVDPYAGAMVLIDCDSLAVPGFLAATVEGSDWYRAPEIITRQVTAPSLLTDRHNLAVLLYLWLLTWHPLIGDKIFAEDASKDDELRYGAQAIYIEHPTDLSNRALRQTLHVDALGPELQELFRQAFVDGLHDPAARPAPIDWLTAFYRVYDRMVPCGGPTCDWRYFIATLSPGLHCPKCGSRLRDPAMLPVLTLLSSDEATVSSFAAKESMHFIVGWHGRVLHHWHVDARATPIYSDAAHPIDREPFARLAYDRQRETWYLINLKLPRLRTSQPSADEEGWWYWPIGAAIPLKASMVVQCDEEPHALQWQISMLKVG